MNAGSFAFHPAGVLDPSEYPGWDEEEGGALANVDAEVGACCWTASQLNLGCCRLCIATAHQGWCCKTCLLCSRGGV